MSELIQLLHLHLLLAFAISKHQYPGILEFFSAIVHTTHHSLMGQNVFQDGRELLGLCATMGMGFRKLDFTVPWNGSLLCPKHSMPY